MTEKEKHEKVSEWWQLESQNFNHDDIEMVNWLIAQAEKLEMVRNEWIVGGGAERIDELLNTRCICYDGDRFTDASGGHTNNPDCPVHGEKKDPPLANEPNWTVFQKGPEPGEVWWKEVDRAILWLRDGLREKE